MRAVYLSITSIFRNNELNIDRQIVAMVNVATPKEYVPILIIEFSPSNDEDLVIMKNVPYCKPRHTRLLHDLSLSANSLVTRIICN